MQILTGEYKSYMKIVGKRAGGSLKVSRPPLQWTLTVGFWMQCRGSFKDKCALFLKILTRRFRNTSETVSSTRLWCEVENATGNGQL